MKRLRIGVATASLAIAAWAGVKIAGRTKVSPVTASKVTSGNANIDAILGPMLRVGTNPWPFADTIYNTAATEHAAQLSTGPYTDSWSATLGGTLTSDTSGSIVGAGTDFQNDFCAGGTDPDGDMLLIYFWPRIEGGIGRFTRSVLSCEDSEHMTVQYGWDSNGRNELALNSWGYGKWQVNGVTDAAYWFFGNSPANYYDNVVSFYRRYYMTNDTQWLMAARSLATRWRDSPIWDAGYSCSADHSSSSCPGSARRSWSVAGLWIHYFDTGDMATLATVKRISAYARVLADAGQVDTYWGASGFDGRETGYLLQTLGYCAAFLTGADQTNCANSLRTVLTTLTSRRVTSGALAGSWPYVWSSAGSFLDMTSGTVAVTNGSAAIRMTGSGGSFSEMTAGASNIVLCATSVLTFPSAAMTGCDGKSYLISAITDSTHATLDSTYQGTTGTHKFVYANPDGGVTLGDGRPAGWAAQPFMVGILGSGFYRAWRGLLAEGDTTSANLYRDYMVEAANFLVSQLRSTKGYGYWATATGCTGSSPDAICTIGYTTSQQRSLVAEAGFHLIQTVIYNNSTTVRAAIDTMYAGYYGKDGGPLSDGTYWDESTYFFTQQTPRFAKWFGIMDGVNSMVGWPAAR